MTRWAALLLLAFALQGAYLIHRMSPTTDEIAFHAPNGYAFLKTRDFRMSPANPALVREWMVLPWLALGPKVDVDHDSWRQADSVPWGQKFIYQDNRAMAETLMVTARAMVLFFGLLLGWLIYRWSSQLYGPKAGLLSLSFYAFSPSFTAHSALAHPDIGVSLFIFWAGYLLWQWLEEGTRKKEWHFALVVALGVAAKFHAIFFAGIYLLIVLWRRGFRPFWRLSWMSGLVSLAVVWASYLFEFKPLLWEGVPRIEEKLAMLPEWLRHFASNVPIPAPSYWLGLAGIAKGHQSPYLHYAFGQWTHQVYPHYYLFSFLVKMTLGFLAVLALRIALVPKAKPSRHETVLILPTLAWFALLTKDSTSVGVRYLFAVIPFLFVWVGALMPLSEGKAWLRWTVIALAVAGAVSALSVFPQSLSYFNEAAGGVKGGHKHVRGSDVDWGQGLKDLKRHMDERSIPRIALHYFGTAEPDFYGIAWERLSNEELRTPAAKVYAISLFHLEHAQWTKEHPPKTIVGGSIAVYDFRG